MTDELKMVLVFRQDLKMSKGKLVAQGAHAVHRLIDECHTWTKDDYRGWYDTWTKGSYVKIALKVPDQQSLFNLLKHLSKSDNVPYVMIVDEGRTQIEKGTKTCIGIGPAPSSLIDVFTKGLKLL